MSTTNTNSSKKSSKTDSNVKKKLAPDPLSSRTDPKVNPNDNQIITRPQINSERGKRTNQNFLKRALKELDFSLKKADLMVNQLRWSTKCLENAMSVYSSLLKYKVHLKLLEGIVLGEEKDDQFFKRFRIIEKEILDNVTYGKVNWRYMKHLQHHYKVKILRKFDDLHNDLLINYKSNTKNGDMDIYIKMSQTEEIEYNRKILKFVIFGLKLLRRIKS